METWKDNPGKLAGYLELALAQRRRSLATFAQRFGTRSAAVRETEQEIIELQQAIAELKSGGVVSLIQTQPPKTK